MPKARRHATAHVLGDGRLWVFGGESPNRVEECVDAFDPKSGRWEEGVAVMEMGGVAEHCSVKLDKDRVIIIGGGMPVPPIQ